MAITRYSSFDKTVNTIAERNAIVNKVNHMTVVVKDAIADPSAGAGKAIYRWDAVDSVWILVSKSTYETISFTTEELTINNGEVQLSNYPVDNKVWNAVILSGQLIYADLNLSAVTISNSKITNIDPTYNGNTLRVTYAYGSIAVQINEAIENKVDAAILNNVKTINGVEIIGTGNIVVEGILPPMKTVNGESLQGAGDIVLVTDISGKADITYVDSGLNNIHTQIDNVIVGNDIMPKVSGISNIGSATNKFGAIYTKEMHIDANTLYVDGVPVLGSSANTINISADTNQGIRVATKGTGQTVLDSENSTVIKTNGINADVLIESQGTGSRSRITSDSTVIITAPVISLEGSISGSSTSDLTFRNITATGNLTVQGSTTFVDSTNVNIKDNIIVVNKGELGSGVSLGYAGIQIDRGDDADSRIIWNEASDKFIMGILGSEKNIASEDFVTSAINAIPSVDLSGYYTKAQIDTSLGNKVDKISGKGLSTEDYTTAEKTKLSSIEVNANNYILPVASSTVLGGVKAGTNISIDVNGVISTNNTYTKDEIGTVAEFVAILN